MPKVTHAGGLFELELPDGWLWHPADAGGGAVPPGPPAVVYFAAHPVIDAADLPSLSRMLSGYLTAAGRPVPPTELVQWSFPGALGFAWQYAEQRKEGPHAWRLWVAGNASAWALISYNSPMESEHAHRAGVDQVVAGFTLRTPD